MVPEKLITDFVERLRAAAGANLKSVILYGSAAAGEFVAAHSDIDLLCVLGETSFAAVAGLAPAVEWWARQKHQLRCLDDARGVTARGGCFFHRVSGYEAALQRALGQRCAQDA